MAWVRISPIAIPYDGGSIGEHGDDAIRDMTGDLSFGDSGYIPVSTASGIFTKNSQTTYFASGITPQQGTGSTHVGINLANQVPTSYENTPTWTAVLLCITY